MHRIAVVFQGDPTDPNAWSGVPSGLSSGLTAAGVTVVPIAAQMRGRSQVKRVLRMSWADEAANPLVARATSWIADRRLRAAGRVDGIVTVGSGYSLSSPAPKVTFEDMTVAQALATPADVYQSLSPRAVQRWSERQRQNYQLSRACCAVSRWCAESIENEYGIGRSKIHVVGFGRNAEPREVDRDWRTPRFLFIGVDWERKRGDAVVRAFTSVRDEYPDATLDLVGGHPPVDVPGVSGHGVLPLGSRQGQEQLAGLLRRATCFVLPSANEPFGISYLDAAGCGVPSVGTTAGGARDAIGDGGRVVDPEDDDALVRAMLELADPGTAQSLGERAMHRVNLFTWQAVAERVLRALRPPGLELDQLADFLYESGPESAPAESGPER